MADIEKVKKDLEEMASGFMVLTFEHVHRHKEYAEKTREALSIINDLQAEIDRLKADKEKAIERIEIKVTTRNACRNDYQLGVMGGLKEALEIIKGKDGEQ